MSALQTAQRVAQAVTIMDEHGKVIKTSKTIFSAWGSAKDAYRQRKAEIAAERAAERRAREALRSKSRHHRPRPTPIQPATIEGAPGSNSQALVKTSKSKHSKSSSGGRRGSVSASVVETGDADAPDGTLVRRGSSGSDAGEAAGGEMVVRTAGMHEEAEGELISPNLTANEIMTTQLLGIAPALLHDPTIVAVQDLLAHVQSIIDEFSCIRFGIATFISELKKCPDTLAMVGIALGEIAALIAKVAPGAMPVIQAAFPTVFALLSSPQVAVVAGIAGAATVVVLGGFKIVQGIMQGQQDDGLAYGEDVHDDEPEPAPAPAPAPITVARIEAPLPPLPLNQALQGLPAPPRRQQEQRLAIKPPPLEVLAFEVAASEDEASSSVAGSPGGDDKKKHSKTSKKDKREKKERAEKEKEKRDKKDKKADKDSSSAKKEKEKDKDKDSKKEKDGSLRTSSTASLPSSTNGTEKSKSSKSRLIRGLFQGASA